MIPKSNRLNAKRHFKSVYQKGKTIRSKLFICRYLRKPTDQPPRISVVISRKKVPGAVERNLIRRRYKAAFKNCMQGLSGIDLIFIPNGSQGQEFKEIARGVEECLKNL
ncbi:ribonuclease P protein component [Candidatus Berkelbacteria bacterium CG10_big_fil_rev_8_21_14_0_10_41_12]|uniref:Ribonuclease P protein component n=1 Tax=Candidatus Berkelbacteria bacterium CG10_big_fil_rev_8_21_14_0_10_41_12 TaxID=1974513 RepID=A0A2M6WXI2_9BACT|nr:MAG: ribonuclease P protein component [Candidatus Berkelbacteria bacterium CG10_big_fil_rev_8_21_14_0_10_41_12]